MAIVLPEIGIAGVEGIEGLEDAKIAERTVPKMEPLVEKTSTLKDLFLYKSMQQPTQAPVIINNQNIQNQPIAQPAIPIIQPPPIENKTEADNNIVSIENNNIIKIEGKQISNQEKTNSRITRTATNKINPRKITGTDGYI